MPDRYTADTITDDALDRLYARIATLEHVAAGNKRHVQLIVPELEQAQAAIKRVRDELAAISSDRNRVDLESFGDGYADAVARIGAALDGDPYGHADLADVIRQTIPDDGLRAKVDEATATLRRIRVLHVRNANTDCCEHCSERDYAVPYPCPTAEALAGPRPDAR